MLQSEYSAKNDGRHLNGSYGRWGWIWNTKSKTVCPHCCIHVVRGGPCPKCGQPSCHISRVPRQGSRKFKQLKHVRFKMDLRHASDYPTAIPRRWPKTGAPPKL